MGAMGSHQTLQQMDQIEILAAPHRLALLRRLMTGPATISQLGTAFGKSPAWIRYHIKQLEAADLVELAETRTTTRVWLDQQIRHLGITTTQIPGYDTELLTHDAVAEAVSRDEADLGLGIQTAAQRHGLDFIPLFQERYDLMLDADRIDEPAFQRFLDQLGTKSFRATLRDMPGYDSAHTGDTQRVLV